MNIYIYIYDNMHKKYNAKKYKTLHPKNQQCGIIEISPIFEKLKIGGPLW